jgi:anthraniloyl-CoA monooxygenase
MTVLRVAVIGGGPGGLSAALMLKRRQPRWDVTVHERHHALSTFGYGVGLRWPALKRLAESAPDCAESIQEASCPLATQTLRRGDAAVNVSSAHGLGVSRSALLTVLTRHADMAGVRIHVGQSVSLAEVGDADVVIAADGAGSRTREARAAQLGVTAQAGDLLYLWCGAAVPLEAMTLCLARTAAGPLAAHIMPYGGGACTFQVDATANVAGQFEAGADDPRGRAITMLERQFAGVLGGARLHTEQTSWSPFTTVRCARWSSGNVVFLGDAAHTAHYTVGSGTALAIEDAVALAEALAGSSSVTAAFEDYESVRKPHAERLQQRADRSQRWWSTLAVRYDLPLHALLVSYLSRTGAVSLSEIARLDWPLLAGCLPPGSLPGNGGSVADRILSRPFVANGASLPTRVYSPLATQHPDQVRTLTVPPGHAAHYLDLAGELVGQGASRIRLVGEGGRDGLLDRLELAELLRAHVGVSTIVRGEAVEDLALGVLCHRTDLVEIAEA